MKTLATISAVLCVTVVVAIAAPRTAPAPRQGVVGDDGWGAQTQRAAITVPSRPADFRSGQTGSQWWAGKDNRSSH